MGLWFYNIVKPQHLRLHENHQWMCAKVRLQGISPTHCGDSQLHLKELNLHDWRAGRESTLDPEHFIDGT